MHLYMICILGFTLGGRQYHWDSYTQLHLGFIVEDKTSEFLCRLLRMGMAYFQSKYTICTPTGSTMISEHLHGILGRVSEVEVHARCRGHAKSYSGPGIIFFTITRDRCINCLPLE